MWGKASALKAGFHFDDWFQGSSIIALLHRAHSSSKATSEAQILNPFFHNHQIQNHIATSNAQPEPLPWKQTGSFSGPAGSSSPRPLGAEHCLVGYKIRFHTTHLPQILSDTLSEKDAVRNPDSPGKKDIIIPMELDPRGILPGSQKTGGLQAILDLRDLNHYLLKDNSRLSPWELSCFF